MTKPLSGGAVALQFQDATIQIITIDGERWVHGADIGRALGYKNPSVAIYNLFNRNADEFTESMSMLSQVQDRYNQSGDAAPPLPNQPGVESTGADQAREVRLFSARGAHLLAMFARTHVAKQFRQWALDVLDGACMIKPDETLTLAQEMSLIRLSVSLMDKVSACTNMDLAEELFMRLMRVNRAMGWQTIPFMDLALACRQRTLPLADGDDDHPAH